MLLIDDDEKLNALLAEYLGRFNFCVRVVAHPDEGTDAATWSSQVQHAGEKCFRSMRSREFQPNSAVVWFNSELEGQESATLSLYVDDPRDLGEDIFGRLETDTIAVREFDTFFGLSNETAKQILSARL